MSDLDDIATEIAYFKAHRAELLTTYAGQYVLIKDESLFGGFPSAEAAYKEGLRRFGIVPFLVQRVTKHERVLFSPFVTAVRPDAGL
ncbi:MAG: hypothetical protein ACRDHF_15065 [Tepidiformaceae bacterium]